MVRRRRRRSHELSDLEGRGPSTITSLHNDVRVPGYIVVEVDGSRFASLPRETADEIGLAIGLTLDDATLQRLSNEARAEGAYQVALRLLDGRSHSAQEILRKLGDRGHEASAAAMAAARLESKGFLDDAAFAHNFVRARVGKGHGWIRLVTDLLARGVDRQIAEHAVNEVIEAEGVDAHQQARALATKRATQLGDLPVQVKRRRVLAFLARRGFGGYEVTEMVEDLLRPTAVARSGKWEVESRK